MNPKCVFFGQLLKELNFPGKRLKFCVSFNVYNIQAANTLGKTIRLLVQCLKYLSPTNQTVY